MGEELHNYKVYITTIITTVASLILSFSDKDFPDYLLPPVALFFTLIICRIASYYQLKKEKNEAKSISNEMVDKAGKIHAIIMASKEEQNNDFEKSKKALDNMLSAHITEMHNEYNEKKESIKRLESHQSKLSEEMFNAAKAVSDQTKNRGD
ncbi:hypothetical protein [Pantoea stewartii]|uniref:hypothetical protein n=1 Tax=Pantoea stewartii TaxID=66269 RepID=UPI0006CF2C26|nr:hypothetical protein [Pantoea stewartii]